MLVFDSQRRDKNLSDGKAHKKSTWDWLHGCLYGFGGWTRAKDLYEGGYVDPNTARWVKDLSRKYFVALSQHEIDLLREILREACTRFAQKCIYLSVAGQVEFVARPSDENQ